MTRPLWSAILIAAGLLAAGCDRSQPKPPSAPQPATAPATQPAPPPPPPDVDGGLDEGSSPILVTPLTREQLAAKRGYVRDDSVPTGAILGFCYVPGKIAAKVPRPAVIDIATGPSAIRDVELKELDYYRKITFKTQDWIRVLAGHEKLKSGRVPVIHAMIMVRGVKKGPVDPLPRRAYQVNNGTIDPLIGFARRGDRVELRTLDPFSSRFIVDDLAGKKSIWKRDLAGNNAEFRGLTAYDKDQLIAWNLTQWRKLAKKIQTDAFTTLGSYRLRCGRHPWQQAYIGVVDNPYAVVPAGYHGRPGVFRIDKAPVGKWTVAVWHPYLKPVAETFEVTVVEDETSEMTIEFRLPEDVE